MSVIAPRPADVEIDPLYEPAGIEIIEVWQITWPGGSFQFPGVKLAEMKFPPANRQYLDLVNLSLFDHAVTVVSDWETASLVPGTHESTAREVPIFNATVNVPAGTYWVTANYYFEGLVDPAVRPPVHLPDGVTFLPRPAAPPTVLTPDPQQVGFIGESPDESDPESYTLGGGLRGTLTAPNGTRYRLVVNNDGTLGTAPV